MTNSLQYRSFRGLLFLFALTGLIIYPVTESAAQTETPIQGKVIEVKGDFVKIDVSGAEVAKGLPATVTRGAAKKVIAKLRITYADDQYVVGKVESGKPKVDDVVSIGEVAQTTKPKPRDSKKSSDSDELPSTPISAKELDELVLGLYKDNALTKPASYPTLRNLFARRFEDRHQRELTVIDEKPEFKKWLQENDEIREEFYIAVDPQFDDLGNALGVFFELWKRHPEKISEYGQLAIATSVVWDTPRAIYDFRRHQKRAKAPLPEEQANGFDNFKFLVDTEDYMEGRIKYVPWEFLKHVVNHSTPLTERQWAGENYLQKRVNFGTCYKDVPYDDVMLKTQSAEGALNGHEYSLANIKKHGGVCAHQADFSARVGKSIGVASEYVRGENSFGSYHAWVMWIELKNATPKGINFSLESSGRYNMDKYYVGELKEPQTGRWITDRDLELRMHTVGMDMQAKRQSDLIMQAYPNLVKNAELDCEAQVQLLGDITKLCPGCEAAWFELSNLSNEYVSLNKRNRSKMLKLVNIMFKNFDHFPDFTWKLFEKMVEFEKDTKKQAGLYRDLLAIYFSAERPDLAMKARLSLTDKLAAAEQPNEAIEGLAATIMAFPGEGRYVPAMLDRIDQLCETEELKAKRVQFYAKLLPVVPRFRISTPSEHCLKIHQRAISVFNEAGSTELAEATKMQVEKIKTAKKPF